MSHISVALDNTGLSTRQDEIVALLIDAGVEFTAVVKHPGTDTAYVIMESEASAITALKHISELTNCRGLSFSCRIDRDYVPPAGLLGEENKGLNGDEQTLLLDEPPLKGGQVRNEEVLKVVAPYYVNLEAERSEDLKKSRMLQNVLKGVLVKLYKTEGGAVTPEWTKQPSLITHLRKRAIIYTSELRHRYRTKVEFSIGVIERDGRPAVQIGPCTRTGSTFRIFGSNCLDGALIFPNACVTISRIFEEQLTEALQAGQILRDDIALLDTVSIRCVGTCTNARFDVSDVLIGIFLRVAANIEPDIALSRLWPVICGIDTFLKRSGVLRAAIVSYAKVIAVVPGRPHRETYYPIALIMNSVLPSRFFVVQRMLNIAFRIGPDTFFQSNLSIAIAMVEYITEVVMLVVGDMDEFTRVTLLDVCCGCGFLGQCIARLLSDRLYDSQKAILVRGLDISADAIANAELNAIENFREDARVSLEYTCISVEQAQTFFSVPAAIGIVDPPRAGLPDGVIRVLRESDLQYLVYVSCNPKALAQNLFQLCYTDKTTLPFHIVSARGFNMFPGCEHVEAVIFLKRCASKEGIVVN
ncbi:putative RNA (uracil-5-)-methyltransferase [Giardia muris]|uniref:Putative RNA (Uracil-5-)-methyltransferase n=1 Tax=Giardia muris TaxID=5742 RepID=A0A4Z1T4A7_GIAMU|nr:putative RNA (uracil-5-)-methyltransferase [Giardia muris]|eukprot:TNJ28823.1 putative RNA (uracil-5-)-methyltransferase [Giardia muris]